MKLIKESMLLANKFCGNNLELHEFSVFYILIFIVFIGVARFDAEFRVFSRRGICGNFIRRRTIEFRGMRVNCIAPDKSDRVFVDVKRTPFYLNEIEVYSFGS